MRQLARELSSLEQIYVVSVSKKGSVIAKETVAAQNEDAAVQSVRDVLTARKIAMRGVSFVVVPVSPADVVSALAANSSGPDAPRLSFRNLTLESSVSYLTRR